MSLTDANGSLSAADVAAVMGNNGKQFRGALNRAPLFLLGESPWKTTSCTTLVQKE